MRPVHQELWHGDYDYCQQQTAMCSSSQGSLEQFLAPITELRSASHQQEPLADFSWSTFSSETQSESELLFQYSSRPSSEPEPEKHVFG